MGDTPAWPCSGHCWRGHWTPFICHSSVNTMGILINSLGRNSTLTGRTSIWKAVLSMHTTQLLGPDRKLLAGQSSAGRVEHERKRDPGSTQWIHRALFESGVGGSASSLLADYLRVSQRNCRASQGPSDGSLRLAFLTASLIFSMTEAGFRMLSRYGSRSFWQLPATPQVWQSRVAGESIGMLNEHRSTAKTDQNPNR